MGVLALGLGALVLSGAVTLSWVNEHPGGGRAEQTGRVEGRRVQRHRIGQVAVPDQAGHEGSPP
jgi:hypothetical protein